MCIRDRCIIYTILITSTIIKYSVPIRIEQMIIKDKERSVKIGDKTYHCVVDVAMGFVGGKWKAVVLWYLKGCLLYTSRCV